MERDFFDLVEDLFDVERHGRNLAGKPRQAVNINSFDEVPNSSWFTNRHGLQRMIPEEITRGPVVDNGPDTSGPWIVFRPKVGGATPGFWIEDPHGDQYILKFDPLDHPELATAAAAMGSRYFHACGYNVPQETIVYWRPEILHVKEGVEFVDWRGNRRPFTEQDLQRILDEVHHLPDGSIRSLASKSLGHVKGPFSYDGRRKDDPNDWYRHEDRRELRGLYVIASFVNHYDTKDNNSLDVWEEDSGRRFLRHYLIDFGSCFGADGDKPKPPKKGYSGMFDWQDIFASTLTLGIKTWSWEHAKPNRYPSIGYFESKFFEPGGFTPIIPNPAFRKMTDRDAYWGAKIVMAFRDEDLQALVRSGQYSDPQAEAYMLATLIERRDKIGRHWFSRVNPLDYFEVSYEDDDLSFKFDDLAVKYGLEDDNAIYRCDIRYRGKRLLDMKEVTTAEFVLTKDELDLLASAYQESSSHDKPKNHLYEMKIRTNRGKSDWSKPTRLWLWYFPEGNRFQLVGIEHLD